MSDVVLANIDYQKHTTDEGDQFQEGLRSAGWVLSGHGYDGVQFVPKILERYHPQRVVVHDKRDWDPGSGICFRPEVVFKLVNELANRKEIFKACVIKDAGSSIHYHERFAKEIGANALIVYYHPQSCSTQAPWMKNHRMVRTYHSVNSDLIQDIPFESQRKDAVVSGAVSDAYPIRRMVVRNAGSFENLDVLHHPGYGNKGSHTPNYLRQLSRYKVHVATASRYGFALRKIIESVALGVTPVTDLPSYDRLPEIDDALVRIPPGAQLRDVQLAIGTALRTWDPRERKMWADKARAFYDYRAIGSRLSGLLV